MKRFTKFLSLALTICFVLTIFSVCAAPMAVSAATVIEIDTAEELRLIGRDEVYPMSGNYVLTADIDVGDKEWIAIGFDSLTDTAPVEFTGSFDGQGHVISNMWTENRTDPENPTYRDIVCNMWGFIANTSGSVTVKNIAFENVHFNLGRFGQKLTYVGTAVGYLEKGSSVIENIAVLSGDIICENFNHQIIVGGIAVGHGSATSAGHIIRNCYNGADITVKPGSYSQYSSYGVAAGILGTSTSINVSTTVVKNCFNSGKITLNKSNLNKKYTYLSVVGDIIARAGNKEGTVAESKAVLQNNLALYGNLDINFTYATQYASDLSSTETIYAVDAGEAEIYETLTSLTDYEGNALWVVSDGKYPVPATFEAYAPDAEIANYTLIEDIEELALIGVDEAYPANGYYKLANDIDASDAEWTPITTFTGLIEGNGYKIYGLNIGKETAVSRDYNGYGLIGTLSGTVRNLKLEDIYFNTYSSSNYSYMGGIAGIMNLGKIYNCYVSGTITDTTSRYSYVGGVAGQSTAAWEIKNCFSDVDITAGYSAAVTGGLLSAAGIMGNAGSAGNLSDCISIGEVNAKYPGYVGAIVSHYLGISLPVTAQRCYSNADIDYWATANMKAFNSQDDNYTLVSEYEMLSGAMSGLMSDEWTDDAVDLIPYLNVFAVPAVSTQTEEDAATAVEAAIRASVLTNYTTESDITAVAEGCLELGSLEFAITNFELTKAIVGTEGNVELTFTVGEATRSLTLSVNPIPEFDYTFSTKYVGRADGTVTITDADYEGKNYRLYWGDANGVLAGYDALATLNDFTVTDETNGILTYTTITNSLIPETATRLYLSVDESLITEVDIDSWRNLSGGELKYISAHVSDTHVGYGRSDDSLTKVFRKMQELGGKFVTNSGDITDRGNAGDYETYKQIHNANYSDITFWATLGNHDILVANRAKGLTAQQSLSYAKAAMNGFANPDHSLGSEYVVTVPDESEEKVLTKDYYWDSKSDAIVEVESDGYILQTDYTMTYDEDMYIFMSVGEEYNSSKSTNYDVALSEQQLTWLEKVLNNYYNVEKKNGQTYFIFHYATLENGLGGVTEDEPGAYSNYNDSSAKLYEILDKYPVIHISGHTHIPFRSDKNIYIGTNHTAVQTPSITKGHQAYEGYIIEHYEGYTLFKGYNFLTEEYIPNAMFYIAEEYQCNPVILSTLKKAKINGSNGTALTYTQTKVYDNRLIGYNENVFKITAPANNGYSGAYAFGAITLTADENHRNELYNWKNNGGDMRFYIKNDADEALTFQPYIYAYSKYVDGTNHKYTQAVATNAITLEANSGWVEVRISAKAFTSKGNFSYFGLGNVADCRFALYTTNFLNTTGGTVYVSNVEFHDHKLETEITTDFDRPYTVNTFAGEKNYSWKTDDTGNITRTFGANTELPFITMATTITASGTYDFSALKNDTQIGLIHTTDNPTANLDEWAIDPNAEMRFWIKTEQDTTFGITLQVGTKNAYMSSISVTGSEDWQEVVIKSSNLTNVSNIYEMATTKATRDVYFLLDIKAGTLVADQKIVVGNRLEFFSDAACIKGDANMDDTVDVRDLVRVKKQIANNATEFIPADIDSNNKLNATDLSYIRKWIINGKWN